jgi:colanic acid/amylovoran biosynthesis glycosyltransferase
MPVVASYCTTFLKPEMRHIYRQVSGLREWQTFVITKERLCAEEFPFEPIETVPRVRQNFVRRFWQKHVQKEPPIVYRGEYGTLANVLDRRRADLMHVYFGHTGVHLRPFLQRWPQPSIVSFHGVDVQPREHQPGYLDQLRGLLQEVTLVLARSASLHERLLALGCPPEKLRFNRTGIPMDAFPFIARTPPPDGAWRLVQACRLIEKKGLDVALRAFARLRQQFPAATFTIAGEGPLHGTLQRWIADLGLGDSVELVGLFVHPSQLTEDQNQEGIPNSMLEAMASGLPIVATLHGGIPEAVRHGVTGLLSPERDEDALLAHLLQLTTDPVRWTTLSTAAAADVRENFEHRAQIAQLEACYTEALALGKSAPK